MTTKLDIPRAIEIVVPFPPGGVDHLLKILLPKASEHLGTAIGIRYVVGKSGTVGAAEVAQAPPTGETLLFAPTGPLVLQPAYRDTPYAPASFDTICRVTESPAAILCSEDSPLGGLEDVVAAARDRPLTYGTIGEGGIPHLGVAAISEAAGITLTPLDFPGAGAAVDALLDGRLDLLSEQSHLATARRGNRGLRILALLSARRVDAFPEVPTACEGGIDVTLSTWNAIVSPRGTPSPFIQACASAFEASSRDPGVIATMQGEAGIKPDYLGPEACARFVAQETVHAKELVRKIRGRAS
jgi:tripartite-type tricarboxylate transporter receptor subunit TctC